MKNNCDLSPQQKAYARKVVSDPVLFVRHVLEKSL
jgi:hypothetical protein